MARWRPTTGDALLAVKPRLGPSMPERIAWLVTLLPDVLLGRNGRCVPLSGRRPSNGKSRPCLPSPESPTGGWMASCSADGQLRLCHRAGPFPFDRLVDSVHVLLEATADGRRNSGNIRFMNLKTRSPRLHLRIPCFDEAFPPQRPATQALPWRGSAS